MRMLKEDGDTLMEHVHEESFRTASPLTFICSFFLCFGVPTLERLILKGCVSLIKICDSIELLEKLNFLDISDCKSLRILPKNMYKLGSLVTLIISGCSTLFGWGLDKSATSSANGQGKWWRTSLLQPWVPQPSRGPEMLCASLPHSLVDLDLSFCELSDNSLPFAFSNLSSLKYLNLSGNFFRSLPDRIKSLSSLQWLSMGACESLDSVLGLLSNLQYLNVANVKPLRRITFQSAPNQLNEIDMFGCSNLVEIEGILKSEPIEKVDRRIIKNLGIDIESIKNLKVKRVILHGHDEIDPIQWNFENQLEGGDEIVVSVLLEDWLEVKECAINIVYEKDEEDNGVVTDDNNDKPYFHWNEVVGGDLSRFQLRTGTYFLRRLLYRDYYGLREMERDLNLFGDIASLEGGLMGPELQKRLWC
ncbi:hypothetical protein LguiB_020934 [Lonicera macranthoides]